MFYFVFVKSAKNHRRDAGVVASRIPLLVRRGGCSIKKISAEPTLAPQTGWSLTSHVSV